MCERLIFILFAVNSFVWTIKGTCDEDAANKNYFRCRDTFKVGSTCSIITNIIGQCSSLLETCRSKAEIKDINADLIKANIAEKKSLDSCEIVEKYRSDGLLQSKNLPNCTKDEETKTRRDFHNCSNALANQVQNTKETVPRQNVSQVICHSLQNISKTCRGLLDICLTLEDRDQIFKAQLDNINQFLQDQLNTTQNLPTLSSCNITSLAVAAGKPALAAGKHTPWSTSSSTKSVSTRSPIEILKLMSEKSSKGVETNLSGGSAGSRVEAASMMGVLVPLALCLARCT